VLPDEAPPDATCAEADDVWADELPVLVQRVAKAMVDHVRAACHDPAFDDLTPVHGLAARYIASHHDVTTVELSRHLGVTKQSASEVVAGLERHGAVVRRPHPGDGRARTIELTDEGRFRLAASRRHWQEVERIWAGLSEAGDLAATRRALQRYLDAQPCP
jgi:DNA-binding MarR family transcriptional regulator